MNELEKSMYALMSSPDRVALYIAKSKDLLDFVREVMTDEDIRGLQLVLKYMEEEDRSCSPEERAAQKTMIKSVKQNPGHWIFDDTNELPRCSVCGGIAMELPWCGNCGSPMELKTSKNNN